jgi:MraZ protein
MLDVRFNQPITVDPKGRITLPVRLKQRLDVEHTRTLVFIVWGDHLRAYTHADFRDRVEKKFLDLDSFDPAEEALQRRALGWATELDFDDGGRLVVPAHLRQMVGIERDVLAISLADRLELWDTARFQAWWKANNAPQDGARA